MSFELRRGVRPFVPVDLERLEALLGRPHVIADHGDEIVEHHDLPHARNLLRGAVVDLADLAAEHRSMRQRCELHARQHRVDAVDGLAVDLVRRVEPLQRLADIDEILRVLERDILGRGLAARGLRQRAIGKLAAARLVRHLALRRRAACRHRPAIAPPRPAPAWRARWRRPRAAASRTPGPTSSRRSPECRRSDCRRASRWPARAAASPATSRHRVLRPGSSQSRCRCPVPSRPAASPAWSRRRRRCG